MLKFKVAVQYLMSDEVEVEADDLDDAMQKVDDTYEPTASKTAVLVDDSWTNIERSANMLDIIISALAREHG